MPHPRIASPRDRLDEARRQIDDLDLDLALLVKRRLELARVAGDAKLELRIAPRDLFREAEVVDRALAVVGESFAVDVRAVYATLFRCEAAYALEIRGARR